MAQKVNLKVTIPNIVKIAGFNYRVTIGGNRNNSELGAEGVWGIHSEHLREIRISSRITKQDISCAFLHEVVHGINSAFCNNSLEESQVRGISNGLFQVLEQLGIHFIEAKNNYDKLGSSRNS